MLINRGHLQRAIKLTSRTRIRPVSSRLSRAVLVSLSRFQP
jgi:hypothetical protein